MKILKRSVLMGLLFTTVFMLSSCSNEDQTPNLADLNEITAEAVVDFVNDDIDNIVMDNMDQIEIIRGEVIDSRRFNPFRDRGGCGIKTHDENAQRIVINFGDGCLGNDNIERSGKIIIDYTSRRRVAGAVITTTFEDFFVNGNKVEGTRVLTNTSSIDTLNERSFNIVASDGRIVFDDGSERTFESERIRVWSLEESSREVTLTITGSSSGTTRNGETFSTEIVSPIIFTNSCSQVGVKVAVEGAKNRTLSGQTTSIDYGAGSCDNLVTVTRPDGVVEEIEIRNRRRQRRG